MGRLPQPVARSTPLLDGQNNEGEEYAECRRGNGEEVDRDDVLDVDIEKRPPRWTRRLAWVNPVLVDGGFGDNMTEYREFGLNAWYPVCLENIIHVSSTAKSLTQNEYPMGTRKTRSTTVLKSLNGFRVVRSVFS